MASNEFSKEERIAWEDICEKFEDNLVLSRNVSKYSVAPEAMERQGDVIYRPVPYIATSNDGLDQTGNFTSATQLTVPATIGFLKNSTWSLDSKELRDMLQENRLGDAAVQKVASDINVALLNTISNQATVVVTRTSALSGYDDVAECDAAFNEQGVQMDMRYLALSSRSYNGMASNLAERQTMQGKPTDAYERSYVGMVAGFETYKMDYANRIAAAAGTTTIDTTVGGAQYYTPEATSVAATGERQNVDNRYQQVTVSDTTSVVAGDCFTIADVESVHHITKNATGQSKTFRVISVDSGTTMTISPPIISAQGGTDAELRYQNCSVTATSATASLTYINYDAADINVFWRYDAIELLPSRLAVPSDAGAAVMRYTSENGLELVWQKQYDIGPSETFYRLDCLFGTVLKSPEQAGILLGAQTP